MLTCRQTLELMTQADYQSLGLHHRLAIQLHLLMCRLCRRNRQQLTFMRRAARQLFASHPHWRLSPESRQRIQQRLNKEPEI